MSFFFLFRRLYRPYHILGRIRDPTLATMGSIYRRRQLNSRWTLDVELSRQALWEIVEEFFGISVASCASFGYRRTFQRRDHNRWSSSNPLIQNSRDRTKESVGRLPDKNGGKYGRHGESRERKSRFVLNGNRDGYSAISPGFDIHKCIARSTGLKPLEFLISTRDSGSVSDSMFSDI